MSWCNPNESGIPQAGPLTVMTCASAYHRRVRRLLIDASFFARTSEPRWLHAMDLALDRDRLVDAFRD